MYEELYLPLPDKEAYLARIGLAGAALTADLESLDRLLTAHLATVPFENLDVLYGGLCPDLGVPALFDKIVTRRRGGYCFELNGLFYRLLEALGFEATPISVRIQMGRTERMPFTHRASLVKLDGQAYYCDVGFGAVPFPNAVPLDGSETPDGFRFELVDGE